MFSNLSLMRKLAVLMALVLTITGCETRVGEDPPAATGQEFGGTKCLEEALPVVEAYFTGEAKTEDVGKAWDCIGSAIEKFKKYVRGNSSDRYTSQELADFLEDNFLTETKRGQISPSLQNEMMKFKQMFVGGSTEHITRAEIDKTLETFRSFKDITMRLNPYMKVLTLNWSVSTSSKMTQEVRYFEEANKEVQAAARLLASLIEKNSQSYVLSDFAKLMEEMGKFFGEEWQFPKTIALYMPMVKKIKKALAGGDENSVAPNEWRRFTLLGARGYILYLRYHYFIKSVPETGSGYRLSYLSRTVEDLFSVFQDMVSEKPEGVVSRQEVSELLATLSALWPEFKVSSGLVFEGMKIKQLFFGGSVDSWSIDDFKNARLKVSRIQALIERFLPYYTIYGKEWDPEFHSDEEAQKLFIEAQIVLETTVRELGLLFDGAYDLNDFHRLLIEIETLYPPPAGRTKLADRVKEFLPLVIDTKNMVLGGTGSTLSGSGWSSLLAFASRAYMNVLYFRYFIKDKGYDKPKTIEHMSFFGNQSLNIVRDVVLRKRGHQFTSVEIQQILKHLVRLEILPAGMQDKALRSLVVVTLNNILMTPEDRLQGRANYSLSLSSVEVLRHELQIWLDTELYMAQILEKSSSYPGASLLRMIKSKLQDPGLSTALREGLREMSLSLDSPVPMTVTEQSHVVISNFYEQEYDGKSLRQLNINRAISRILLRAFAKDLDRITEYKGLTLPETESAYLNLQPIFVELKMIEPGNTQFASSRFREANIFTPHADGNDLASYQEVTDLVGMIVSGLSIHEQLKEQLVKDCIGRNETVADGTLVSLKCAQNSYGNSMLKVMGSVPEFLRFMRSSNKEDWAVFLGNVFKAAGHVPNADGVVRMGDIALTPHVIQYIEMVYARFDKNRDNIIDAGEAVKAFPAFKGILVELAQQQLKDGSLKESDLVDLFTYILRYGKPPETMKEKIHFVLFWKDKPLKWDVWANRIQISKILGYIADQVAKSSSKPSQLISSPPSLSHYSQ